MKKFYFLLHSFLLVGVLSVKAQNLYSLNDTWLDLETFKKSDSVGNAETDFKKASKYAARFNEPRSMNDALKTAQYKDRTFRLVDDNHVGIKTAGVAREIVISCNNNENEYELIPGNNFFIPVTDGIMHVQRFEEKTGYRVTKYDEYGKVRMKQSFPHTITVTRAGTEFKQPYLNYFAHTDRFMVFTSLASHDIHKTIVIDLKDGKASPIESNVCGLIRSADDKGIAGYIIRDDAAKCLSVASSAGKWTLKEPNLGKVMGETILTDTVLVMARYYKGAPGISVAAFNAKTGKVLWVADVKKPTAGQVNVYLSVFKDQLLLEGNDAKGDYLQAFDIKTGKRSFSTI